MPYGDDGIWREHYSLHTFDLDAQMRLSPQAACNFLIETAAHNADALGFSVPQLLEQQRTWFLSRLILRIRSSRPTAIPACGPPRSLSPLKLTRSAPAWNTRMPRRSSGLCTHACRRCRSTP